MLLVLNRLDLTAHFDEGQRYCDLCGCFSAQPVGEDVRKAVIPSEGGADVGAHHLLKTEIHFDVTLLRLPNARLSSQVKAPLAHRKLDFLDVFCLWALGSLFGLKLDAVSFSQ
jgi:hypothetical protein